MSQTMPPEIDLTQTVKCCVCVKSAGDDLGMMIGGMCKTNKSEISKFKSPPSSVTSFDRIWRKLSWQNNLLCLYHYAVFDLGEMMTKYIPTIWILGNISASWGKMWRFWNMSQSRDCSLLLWFIAFMTISKFSPGQRNMRRFLNLNFNSPEMALFWSSL